MTDTLLAEEGFMPRPHSLFRQHLPQLHLCSELLRLLLIGGYVTLHPLCLIPPYVCKARITSLLSHLLHPDTIPHFLSFPFSDCRNGEGKECEPAFLFRRKKKLDKQAAAVPIPMTSHFVGILDSVYVCVFFLHVFSHFDPRVVAVESCHRAIRLFPAEC